MPIEPISVSRNTVREIDPTSRDGLWSSTHGSSNGGKDGSNGSSWDKAIGAARKLFGLDGKAERKEADEEADEARRSERSLRRPERAAPGFSGRALGRFGMSQPDGLLANLRSSTSSEEARAADASSEPPTRRDIHNADATESRAEPREKAEDVMAEAPLDESDAPALEVEEPIEDEEDDEKVGRSHVPMELPVLNRAQAPAVPLSVSQAPEARGPQVAAVATHSDPAAAQAIEPQDVRGQVAASIRSLSLAGETSAAQVEGSDTVVQMPSQAASLVSSRQAMADAVSAQPQPVRPIGQVPAEEGTASKVQAVLAAASGAVSNGAARPEGQSLAGQSGTLPAENAAPAAARNAAPASQVIQAAQSQSPQAPQATQSTETVPAPVAETPEASLAFDAEKAKAALSAALDRGQAAIRKGPAPAAAPQATQAKAMEMSSVTPSKAPESATSASANSLPATSSDAKGEGLQSFASDEAAKSHPQPKSATPAFGLRSSSPNRVADGQSEARAAAVANEQAQQVSANSRLASQGTQVAMAAANVAREGRPAVARPAGAAPVQGLGAAAAGAAPGGLTTAPSQAGMAGSASGQGHSQHGGSERGGSPADFEATLAARTGASKGGEKAGGDPAQAFDLKGASTGDARKAQAAAKAQTTSYVAKTAEEVKEVYKTLTRSIDRLVSSNQSTINLRINFDQGGSVALRVTMDGGQINTSMQTDVPGLEALIKQNWSDLANDWSQKGVKLTPPQFQQSPQQQGSSSDAWSHNQGSHDGRGFGSQGQEFSGAQGRRPNGASSSGRGNRAPGGESEIGLDASKVAASQGGEVITDKEIRTYA